MGRLAPTATTGAWDGCIGAGGHGPSNRGTWAHAWEAPPHQEGVREAHGSRRTRPLPVSTPRPSPLLPCFPSRWDNRSPTRSQVPGLRATAPDCGRSPWDHHCRDPGDRLPALAPRQAAWIWAHTHFSHAAWERPQTAELSAEPDRGGKDMRPKRRESISFPFVHTMRPSGFWRQSHERGDSKPIPHRALPLAGAARATTTRLGWAMVCKCVWGAFPGPKAAPPSAQKPRPQSCAHEPLRQKQPQGNQDAFRKPGKRPARSTGESVYTAGKEYGRSQSLQVCDTQVPAAAGHSSQSLPEPPLLSCPCHSDPLRRP